MRTKRISMAVAVATLVAATLLWGVNRSPTELGDEELAAIRGGRGPATYCTPHPNCSGPVVYCSDCTPGANVGDPCNPSTITTYYNPEHCGDVASPRQCGETASVMVYCLTVSDCVTAFQGTQKVCTAASSTSYGQAMTTDMTRCRNLTLFTASNPP